MKKSRILIVISLIAILIFVIFSLRKNDRITFKNKGVTYALTVNGVRQNSFPSKGLYRVDTECTNATCRWDYDAWKLYMEDISENVSCNITFTTIAKTTFNNYIIGLAGTTQGIGQVVNENGYRFEGKNPNNWVWFNNELWRIIGVFDSATHGVTNTNLVKIIRNESIGGLSWNKSGTNDWTNSSLYKLLNPVTGDTKSGAYYNKFDGTNSGYCYVDKSITTICDYSNIGIDTSYRGMIREVTWKLGGHTTQAATASTFYTAERGSATGNNNAYAKEIIGHIGLMYPSDYGYSVLANSCARTVNLSAYNTSECSGQSWLFGYGREWILTPLSSSSLNSGALYIIGGISSRDVCYNETVRPVLYLDSSVYIIDGTGTEADPYIIGM